MVGDETALLSVGSRQGEPCPMTPERGVRSNAMVVFLQAAIMSGNERDAKTMHDCAPWRLRSRYSRKPPFSRQPENLEALVGTYQRDLSERVGTGISFRPLKAASAMLAWQTSISLEAC